MLTLLETIKRNRGQAAVCRCSCGTTVTLSLSEFQSGHQKTCGKKECTSRLLSLVRTGKRRPDMVGKTPANKVDRTGRVYGRLKALEESEPGRWLCECECGNQETVLSTNLSNYAKNNRGCRHCARRKDITGERRGLLIAEKPEEGKIKGRHPLWTFRCDCGNTIEGTVREFHANWLRSCGCHDSTYASWSCMMSRCYDPKNNRYKYYGGRGIKVSSHWHAFDNFVKDMGERPKRYNLGRKRAEGHYAKNNCIWEHVSKNGPDTNYGIPTKPGLAKGAKPRTYTQPLTE